MTLQNSVPTAARDAKIAELCYLMYHREIIVPDFDMQSPSDRVRAAIWLLARLERAA